MALQVATPRKRGFDGLPLHPNYLDRCLCCLEALKVSKEWWQGLSPSPLLVKIPRPGSKRPDGITSTRTSEPNGSTDS
eukprot:6294117-Amphidinium_carterae.2